MNKNDRNMRKKEFEQKKHNIAPSHKTNNGTSGTSGVQYSFKLNRKTGKPEFHKVGGSLKGLKVVGGDKPLTVPKGEKKYLQKSRTRLFRIATNRMAHKLDQTHHNYDMLYNPGSNQYELIEVNDKKTFEHANKVAHQKNDLLIFNFGYIIGVMHAAVGYEDYYTFEHLADIIKLNSLTKPRYLPKMSDEVYQLLVVMCEDRLCPKRYIDEALSLEASMEYIICASQINYAIKKHPNNPEYIYHTLNDLVVDYDTHQFSIWPKSIAQAASFAIQRNIKGKIILTEANDYIHSNKKRTIQIIKRESMRYINADLKKHKLQIRLNNLLRDLDNNIYGNNMPQLKATFKQLVQMITKYPAMTQQVDEETLGVHTEFRKEDMTKAQDREFKVFIIESMLASAQFIYDDNDLYEMNGNLRAWISQRNNFFYKHVYNKMNPRFALPARTKQEASNDFSRIIQFINAHKVELIKEVQIPFYRI